MNDSFRIVFDNSPSSNVSLAFDLLADDYDETFTRSPIGRAQRRSVWSVLSRTFKSGDSVLELNCGTGEDAVFLGSRGVTVLACDASQQMIATAERRHIVEGASLPIVFCHLATEKIHELRPAVRFNGAFSNFSGLNCVGDIQSVATALSQLIQPGGKLLLCCSTRFCFIETLHYLMKRKPRKGIRRWRGETTAFLKGEHFSMYYPTLRTWKKQFAPHFRLGTCKGVGVAIPPTYCDAWSRKHPKLFRWLCSLEPLIAKLPLFRVTGDHMLLCFEKVSP